MVKPLQIVAFKWGDRYTEMHVCKLFAMLQRNLTIPWEPVLISDTPPTHDHGWGVRYIPLWSDMRETALCGVRLRAFGEDMREVIGPRFAWLDLDVVVTGNVDHIFGRTEPFVALRPAGPPFPINGSLVMMNAGARSSVLYRWTPELYESGRAYWAARGVHSGAVSDEGYMGMMLPHEPSITREDGVYYFRRDLDSGRRNLPSDARLVVMNGRAFDPTFPRAQKLSWVRENYR